MSVANEYRGRARELQAIADAWQRAAEEATDPEQRQRLMDKARRVKEQSEQEARLSDRDTTGPQK
ncbi:DUF6381 family protein [Streptomyces sp. WM6378]|uniref:DUF6381 family protein n=1 Tax=Streptomyces sp. WM6378 TaxID=1415557 RepID=UPI0006ADEE49|nr:DUF6381 family protein [Streptomyces sp. WM6378]KOU51872.1 hypothetical protein ADK54_08080 [Streptomyces sp. WM6378]